MKTLITQTRRTKKKPILWRIEYRDNGQWSQGNTYQTREEAESYAERTGRGYRVVRVI